MIDCPVILSRTTVGISCFVKQNNNEDAQASVNIYVPR